MSLSVADKVLAMISAKSETPSDLLSLDTNLLQVDLDSLEFVELMQDIAEQFVEVPDEQWGKFKTIGDLVRTIESLLSA